MSRGVDDDAGFTDGVTARPTLWNCVRKGRSEDETGRRLISIEVLDHLVDLARAVAQATPTTDGLLQRRVPDDALVPRPTTAEF